MTPTSDRRAAVEPYKVKLLFILHVMVHISWPVVEGADQYTLTRCGSSFNDLQMALIGKASLQIEMVAFQGNSCVKKEDKRGRTREYQIVNHYSGKWLPLSQVNQPWTNMVP